MNRKGISRRFRHERFALAADVAGGNRLFDIIVEDDEVASFCISFLIEKKCGRCTFLPLNKLRRKLKTTRNPVSETDDVIPFLENALQYNEKVDSRPDNPPYR